MKSTQQNLPTYCYYNNKRYYIYKSYDTKSLFISDCIKLNTDCDGNPIYYIIPVPNINIFKAFKKSYYIRDDYYGFEIFKSDEYPYEFTKLLDDFFVIHETA